MATRLTLSRLIIAPLIIPIFLAQLLPANVFFFNVLLALLFLLFGMTDFLDGFLARRFNKETDFGKQLDPLADKFLIYSTLIALLAADKIYFFWVIIFIGREFFVMGLRQLSLERCYRVFPVSRLAKCKTGMQVALLTIIILNPEQQLGYTSIWNIGEACLLCAALALSLVSAYHYYRACVSSMQDQANQWE